MYRGARRDTFYYPHCITRASIFGEIGTSLGSLRQWFSDTPHVIASDNEVIAILSPSYGSNESTMFPIPNANVASTSKTFLSYETAGDRYHILQELSSRIKSYNQRIAQGKRTLQDACFEYMT